MPIAVVVSGIEVVIENILILIGWKIGKNIENFNSKKKINIPLKHIKQWLITYNFYWSLYWFLSVIYFYALLLF